jgi:ApbE superfamily uncharacterized protein (UPF0280 family)
MAVSRDQNHNERKVVMAREIARRREAPPVARLLALAIGAAAVGAMAVGALAIGRMAVGRMAIGRARFGAIEVDELTVRKLRVLERDDG